MKLMGMGLDLTGNALFTPMEEETVEKSLAAALESNAGRVKSLDRATAPAIAFRGEIERKTIDLGDPRAAGWTFLVNSADPQRADIERLMEPLAKHRAMTDPANPLLYNGESPDEWFDWLHENYLGLDRDGKQVPHYVLIVGEPDQVPFRFQSVLATVASVGRVAFDSLGDLQQYIKKLIRIETAANPLVSKEAFMFAPDGGPSEPTYFSHKYMVEPLAREIRDELGFAVRAIVGEEATKMNLTAALSSSNSALVYTASHGLGAIDESADYQKQYNGAICCQHAGRLNSDALFSANDVPLNQPFLEGAVFFQFACFGYGTPAESDYAHWIDKVPKKYTDADFVAALPKRLLAHPRGPIGFVGHLDTAFLHGFTDAEAPNILERWHSRIAPFKKAVDQLLSVQPSGLAMSDMCTRYSACNALITNTYDRQCRRRLTWTPELKARFLDTWITRSDAQNYMIFGDPAARLRIST
ncbi:MAG: hypothetical protein ACXVIU_09810 [Halobacteriota archaeon]